MKKYDDGLGLIYRHLDSRYEMANLLRKDDEATFEREFRRGVLPREVLQEMSDTIDALDEVGLEYLGRALSVRRTAMSRRAFVRCRTRRPVPLVVEPDRLPVVYSTEVRPLSSLDTFSLSDSGPHAPPCLMGGPP